MSDYDQEIREFIENRWAEARTALTLIDPDFVSQVDTLVRASNISLIIPGKEVLPEPSHQLSDRWHSLLSLTNEIVQELGRLRMTVEFMNPEFNSNVNREQTTFFFDVWIQRIFNLCEKIIAMMKHAIRLRRDEQGLSTHVILEKEYIDRVKIEVRDKIEILRTPSVHGEGGDGNLSARVITVDHQSWEVIVLGGSQMIDRILETSYEENAYMSAQRFYELSIANNSNAVQTLGGILNELDQTLISANPA